MKIVVVGAGVAGLSSAYMLCREHDVTLYEKDDRVGGHAYTVDVKFPDRTIAVDVGFIIFNNHTYPNLVRLFSELNLTGVDTLMDFSVSIDNGAYEWIVGRPTTMMRQYGRLLDPSFYLTVYEILRFFRVANRDLSNGTVGEITIQDYVEKHKFGKSFLSRFLVPMGASIWSASARDFLQQPAQILLSFLKNHGLLTPNTPGWLTLPGGSRTYVDKIEISLSGRIRKSTQVARVKRTESGVSLTDENGTEEKFDHVIFACHAPEVVSILEDIDESEFEILEKFKYQKNIGFLHGDERLMPISRKVWGSWNCLLKTDDLNSDKPVSITYWMNKLQHIDDNFPLFVSLNPPRTPETSKIYQKLEFEHPKFSIDTMKAQRKLHSIQGIKNTWFCGAYTGHGFHEDGIRSALEIVEKIGCLKVPLLGHARIFA